MLKQNKLILLTLRLTKCATMIYSYYSTIDAIMSVVVFSAFVALFFCEKHQPEETERKTSDAHHHTANSQALFYDTNLIIRRGGLNFLR